MGRADGLGIVFSILFLPSQVQPAHHNPRRDVRPLHQGPPDEGQELGFSHLFII